MTVEELITKYGRPQGTSQVKDINKPSIDVSELETRWGISTKKSTTPKLGMFAGIGQDIKARGTKLGEQLERISGQDKNLGIRDIPEVALNVAGQGIGAGYDIAGRTIGAVTPEPVKNVAGSIIGGALNWAMEPGKEGLEKIARVGEAMKPRVKTDIESAFNIASLFPLGKAAEGTEVATKSIKPGLKAMAESTASKAEREALKATGKVIQGQTKVIPKAAKTLSELDVSGIKTYKDLSKKLSVDISDKMTAVDKAYEANKTPVKLNKLTQVSTAGEGAGAVSVKVNYVKDALNQLTELYGTIKDPANLAKVKTLINKGNTTGLTPTEINKIARQYGTEFGSKAFNKIGDPLTSVNAQAFENTRKGLKSTARSFLPDDAAKAMDMQIGDSIEVKRLTDKMVENVNKLEQKIVKRSVIEKIARGLGTTVDFLTMGGPKAFVQKLFFPSNVGLKTMNAIDLQNALQRNLKLIQQLNTLPEETIPGKILEFLNNPKAGLSIEDVSLKGEGTVPKTVTKPLPKVLEPLAKEASKYKNADDFFNAVNLKSDEEAQKLGFHTTIYGNTHPELEKFNGGDLFDFYNKINKPLPKQMSAEELLEQMNTPEWKQGQIKVLQDQIEKSKNNKWSTPDEKAAFIKIKEEQIARYKKELSLPPKEVQPLVEDYVYHGTTEARARNIAKEGLKGGYVSQGEIGKYTYLSTNEQYAKTYAERKGGTNNAILRIIKTPDMELDPRIVQKGKNLDLRTLKSIPAKNIEIKTPKGWVKITDYR